MINLGILGAGRIAEVHIRGIATGVPGARMRAIASPHMDEKRAAWARSFGVEHAYDDAERIFRDPAIDAVLILSSTDTHYDLTMRALAAGKHIFSEKPIDHNLARCREVADAVRASGKQYQIGFNRRYDHNYLAMKRAIDAGKIGEVQFLRFCSRDAIRPPKSFIAGSGGMMMDMSVHDFDMVSYMAGSPVTEVFSYGANLIDPEIGKAGDIDTAVTVLKFESGALGVIDNSREAVYGYDQRAEAFGSKGCVTIGNDAPSTALVSGVSGVTGEKPLWYFLERYMGSYQAEVAAFVRCLETGEPVSPSVEAGLAPVRIALAVYKSQREHRPVAISEIV